MNESKMNLYLVDNSDYYPGIQILLGSCSLYSKEELAEYVKEWSKNGQRK